MQSSVKIKSKNNLQKLPPELILKVTEFLTYIDGSKLGSTCKFMFGILKKYNPYCHKVSDNLLKLIISRNTDLSKIYIEDASKISSDTLTSLLSQCKNLQELYFRNSTVKSIKIQSPILRVLDLTNGKELSTLEFENTNSLHTLILDSCKLLNLGYDVMNLKNLKHLSLQQNIGFVDADIEGFASSWSSLESLNLNGCKGITDISLEIIGSNCKNLNKLSISGCFKISDYGIKKLLNSNIRITDLNVSACIQLTDESMKIFSLTPKIKSLSIARCNKCITKNGINYLKQCYTLTSLTLTFLEINDDIIAEICESLKHLEKLVISWCKGITDWGLREIARKCKSLKELDISHTTRISDKGLEYLVDNFSNQSGLRKLIAVSCGTALSKQALERFRKRWNHCILIC